MFNPGFCHCDLTVSLCEVCTPQHNEHLAELASARAYEPKQADLRPEAASLVKRGAISASDFRTSTRHMRALSMKNPNRRKVFELFGFYLPEREARDLLKKIHDYKWIEAEKAGFDIWSDNNACDPFKTAATHWAGKYMDHSKNHTDPVAA